MSKYNIAHQLGSKPRTRDVLLPGGENIDFGTMLLPQTVLQGLCSAGFVKPSPIQLKAIPLARCGFDLIVQAKSGTGKTCVFAVTALEHVVLESNRLQAIVLAPTREIAQQIQHVISAIGRYQKNLKVKTFIGGVPLQEDKINSVNCQIAVGAPGRLRHLIEEKHLLVDAVRLVVFDEADKLMEETFQNDINFIFRCLPESKQVIACSATYTQDLLNFLGNYMQSATHVTPGQDPSPILIGLRHLVCIESASRNHLSKLKSKEACLIKILKNVSFLQCLVFTNYHSRAESICNGLKRNGWSASWIAGKQNQTTRTAVMSNVKDLKVRILVTTDLTARGIDLHEVNLVVNMDIPPDHHTYLHRMGRAGRYGGHGLVITVITEDEMNKFQRLLGAIGGSYASAYVIPDSKPTDNLWSCDITQFELVVGVHRADTDINVDDTTDDGDEDEQEKFSDSDDSELDIEMKEFKNENDFKDKSMNQDGSKSTKRDSNDFNQETVEIKDEIDDFSDDVKAEGSKDIKEELSSESDGNEKVSQKNRSSVLNDDSSSDAEKYSDSDDNESNDCMNENDNETEEDAENKTEYFDALSKFGLKLLQYTNSNQTDLQSYENLDKSLSLFSENKRITNDIVCKKLLEPTGTIDIEYVERFSKKLNRDFNNLINTARDVNAKTIVNWLLNDTTGEPLSKSFDNCGRKENTAESNLKIKDPEYYSPSSSSSSLSDGELPPSSSSSDDGDERDDLKSFKNVGNKYNRIKCHEIESKLNNIHLKNSDSGKGKSPNVIEDVAKKLSNKDSEETVLFLRKDKSERKRKKIGNLGDSSSQLSNEDKSDNSNNIKMESVLPGKNKNVKKVKHNDMTACSRVANDSKRNENNYKYFDRIARNSHEACSRVGHQSSDASAYSGVSGDQYGYSNVFDYSRADSNGCSVRNPHNQYVQGQQYPFGNPNIYNMSNMPKEVQNWYNLWYRQTANLRWCVGYNQYMKHMLNPPKK